MTISKKKIDSEIDFVFFLDKLLILLVFVVNFGKKILEARIFSPRLAPSVLPLDFSVT